MGEALGPVALFLLVGGFVGALVLVSKPNARRWLSAAVAGSLAFQAIYLVLLAGGRDPYFDPDHVTRWEFAGRDGNQWIVVVAIVAALAAAAGLLIGIGRVAPIAAAISCVLVFMAAFALTVGH